MRLYEFLFESPLSTVDDPTEKEQYYDIHRHRESGRERHGYEQLGRGVEAVVVKDKIGPGVIKVLGNDLEIRKDPYMQYILMSRRYANENPYLPRVESIQKFADPNTSSMWKPRSYYVIKLEKLAPLQSLSSEEAAFIFNTIFGTNLELTTDTNLITMLYWAFEGAGPLMAPELKPIVDRRLLAVKHLIEKIVSTTNASMDMHKGNVMIRRTPYGAQLVVTDPVIY